MILAMVENQAGDCMFPESWNEILIAVTLTEEVFCLTEVRAERKKKCQHVPTLFGKYFIRQIIPLLWKHTHTQTHMANYTSLTSGISEHSF